MFDYKLATAVFALILVATPASFARDEDADTDSSSIQIVDLSSNHSIDALIQQLGAEDWATRETASNSLIQCGTQIVPQLQHALTEADDPEVRSRLETAIAQINENELIGGSVISLDFVDAPLSEVIQSLNKQARCNIAINVPDQATGRKVTVQVEHVSFWKAIDEIERATGLYFGIQQQVWMLGRQGRAVPGGITCESGPLQFIATQYQLSASYADGDFGIGKSNLMVSVRGEPKVRLAPGKTRITIERAVDELGNNLIASRDESGIWLNEWAIGSANIPLARPRGIGTKIVELAGYVELSLATRVESINIENLAEFESFERCVGTTRLRFDPPNEAERSQLQPGWQAIKISAIDNVNRELLQQRLGSAIGMARVVDTQGRPASRPSVNFSTGDVPNEFRYFITFQPGAADPESVLSMRLVIPVEYRQVTTRFSFKDLPLP